MMNKVINLDDPAIYQELDGSNMLSYLHETPNLYRKAWQMTMDFHLPPDYRQVKNIVVIGMGGSAIGGDLVKDLVLSESKRPVFIFRDYDLPKFVDSDTLVIASSNSGATEETLSAFQQALTVKAKTVAITAGAKLKIIAEQANMPVFSFKYSAPPRAALPLSFLPILGILQELDIISDKSTDVAEAIGLLDNLSLKLNERNPASENPAKKLAQKIYGHIPVIYSAGITSETAHRWKTQFNENGKTWAFYEFFPELCHNAVVGYQFPQEVSSKILVIFLHSNLIHKRIELRWNITQHLLQQADIEYQIIEGEGNNPLSHITSLILFGDYVSYYLAMLNRTDPTPIKAIDYLKEELSKNQ